MLPGRCLFDVYVYIYILHAYHVLGVSNKLVNLLSNVKEIPLIDTKTRKQDNQRTR